MFLRLRYQHGIGVHCSRSKKLGRGVFICSLLTRPTGGFRAEYSFCYTLDAEIRRDPNREIGYWITDVWDTNADLWETKKNAQDDRLSKGWQTTDYTKGKQNKTQLADALRMTLQRTLQTQCSTTESAETMQGIQQHPDVPEEAVVVS
ncbi:hypothetical protein Tco_0800291 [Tanacetum coccineum]|uniref:Uncharacterized protein n=1 Tax=Tanacetum coccineum TaxID=301880 RepID=A0ABQ4ZX46_9ASTR